MHSHICTPAFSPSRATGVEGGGGEEEKEARGTNGRRPSAGNGGPAPFALTRASTSQAAAHWVLRILRRCGRKARRWTSQSRTLVSRAGLKVRLWRAERASAAAETSPWPRTGLLLPPWTNPSEASSRLLVALDAEPCTTNSARVDEGHDGGHAGMLIMDAEVLWLSWVDEKLFPMPAETAAR